MHLLNEALLRMLTGWHNMQARLRDEDGQTLAEYGLIMALIAVAVVVVAVIAFRDAIIGAFNNATDCLGNLATCTTP
jgi:Flp pilus assembly pilin Flp